MDAVVFQETTVSTSSCKGQGTKEEPSACRRPWRHHLSFSSPSDLSFQSFDDLFARLKRKERNMRVKKKEGVRTSALRRGHERVRSLKERDGLDVKSPRFQLLVDDIRELRDKEKQLRD